MAIQRQRKPAWTYARQGNHTQEQFERENYLLDPIVSGDSQWYSDEDGEPPAPSVSKYRERRLDRPETHAYGNRTIDYNTIDESTDTQRQPRRRQTQRIENDVIYRQVSFAERCKRAFIWYMLGVLSGLLLFFAYGPLLFGRV